MQQSTSPARRLVPRILVAVFLAGSLAAQRDSEFMTEFRKAMANHDSDAMASLVKKHDQSATMAVIDTCELITAGSSDELEAEIEALGKAWRAAYDTNFVAQQYEYFSLLSGANKRHRFDLIERYRLQFGEFAKASEAKDEGKLQQLGIEFQGMSKSFEQVGDKYMGSVCAMHYGQCFDEGLGGGNADLKRACEGYGRAVKLRAEIGLTDSLYKVTKARFDELEFAGYGDPTKGPNARAAARAESDTSYAPRVLDTSFELVSDIDAIERPLYFGDSVYPMWTQLSLGAKDSTAEFPAIEHSPKIVRESAAKAAVDLDGDGTGDVDVPVTGKATAVEVTLGEGEYARKWGFLATTGQERDTYQGIQPFNLGPNDDQMAIFVAPAGSVVATIGETRIQVFDDNMDGVYGSEPKGWQLIGLLDGYNQFDTDSILVGDAKRALPWSELVQVGEDWYRFQRDESTDELVVSKRDVETGTLKLDMKGLSADYLVVRGKGANEQVFIDVAASKKGVEVPVGAYELFAGRVSKGSRNQKMKALVLAGRNTPSWHVDAGIDTTIKLGAPFGFDFSFSEDDDKATIVGRSIVVTGSADETYQRLWNCVVRPEASERPVGSKKGGKPEKMKPLESQEEMALFGGEGFYYVWFPTDLTLEKKKSGEDVEIQLTEKKNKLFGKIESDWKAR